MTNLITLAISIGVRTCQHSVTEVGVGGGGGILWVVLWLWCRLTLLVMCCCVAHHLWQDQGGSCVQFSPTGSEVIKTSPSQASPAQCLEMRQKLPSSITTVTQPFFTLLIKIPMTGPKHTGAWNIRPDSFQDVHLNCCSPVGGRGGLIWDHVPGCKDPRR